MNRRILAVFAAALIVLVAGFLIWRGTSDESHPAAHEESREGVVQDDSGRRVLYWYDPMMPAQRFKRPGKSPFMDMQLVPKYADEGGDAAVRISPALAQNLGIRTGIVERTRLGESVLAVGRIEVDERRRHEVPSRVSGFVERLHVRAVGDRVARGTKLAEIYSPELFSAQQEFLALRRATNMSGSEALVQAARERLRLFGMVAEEIEAIARAGIAQTRFGMYSPAAGFVSELNVREGAQIAAGATLMSISDLSFVWLVADVPEREAGSIRKADPITARLESAPGKEFTGTVDYVYPTLDSATRTTRVRMVLPNKDTELRPGMFARVHIRSSAREALTVPSEAVIYTGSRSIVIVQQDEAFRPVEVRTGVEHEGRTEILAGLDEGEKVVASGQFLIDSEASLSGVLARLSQSRPLTSGTEASAQEPSALPATVTATGTVISLDHAGGRATLAHEPIAELGWPQMTMPFRFADPNAIHALNAGDVIRFTLRTQAQDGEYVIESVSKDVAP